MPDMVATETLPSDLHNIYLENINIVDPLSVMEKELKYLQH